jgi:hypothetical protein
MDGLTIFLGIIAAVLVFFGKNQWKEANWAGKTGIIVALLIVLSGARWSYLKHQKELLIEKITARFGDFRDLFGATIPKLCAGECSGTGWPVGPNGLFFVEGSGPLFRIYVKDGKLFVDLVVWGMNGKAIAVIDRNTWTMYSDDYEYNNDDTGFEIVTKGDRKAYFQVYLKGGIAHILGVVTNKDGVGVKFYQSRGTKVHEKADEWEELNYIAILPSNDKEKTRKAYEAVATPIFKYPREKYVGVRVN